MRLLLTGATGAAGSEILRAALADPAITAITVLTRKPLAAHVDPAPKATIVVHEDFLSYPASLNLSQFDACIWALGSASGGMNETTYTRITYDFPMAAIKSLKEAGVGSAAKPFRFVYLSGEGADPSGKSRVLFAKVKGRTEADLHSFAAASDGTLKAHFMRPGYFFPADPGDRRVIRSRSSGILDRVLSPVFSTVIPSMYLPIRDLGNFAVRAALGEFGDEELFRNARIRELMKSGC